MTKGTTQAARSRRVRWSTVGFLGLLLGVLAPLALTTPPASAAGLACNPSDRTYYEVCVNVQNGQVRGWTRYHYGNGVFSPATVYVRQCRVDLTACVTVAANRDSGTDYVSTSRKPASYGHIYQACASFYVYVDGEIIAPVTNICSGWRSYP